LIPKKLSRMKVSDMDAQGLARRKLATAGVDAPLR
jgi:hypothetical protein